MCKKIYIFLVFIVLIVIIGCFKEKNPISPPENQPDPHQFIRGNIILENQDNFAHCPVILDTLMIGTITDSVGYYEIFLSDSLSDLKGKFKIYYY